MACGPEAMAEDKQIGNTRTREVFFVAALLSPLSARSLLSLSLSLSLPFPAPLRRGTSLDICGIDLVCSGEHFIRRLFFFFFFGKFLLISMVFLFSLRFVFVCELCSVFYVCVSLLIRAWL